MSTLSRGLYQALITEALAEELNGLGETLHARREPLHNYDVADRLSTHLARVFQRAIQDVNDEKRVQTAIELLRKILPLIVETTGAKALSAEQPTNAAEFLRAVLGFSPDGRPEELSEPLIPLLDTALLTNAPGDPRVGRQIVEEIPSADRIDIVMAFIRRSGIRPMLDSLRRHCQSGRSLRILTTVYTNSTEADALAELRDIGAEIRVSYDTSSTRLHAKAWLFYRKSGFSTAYIGSSNLTHSAQVSGLEWNTRFSAVRNPSVVEKAAAVFEGYWNSADFERLDLHEFAERTSNEVPHYIPAIELYPKPFQERLLEQIALSRQQGFHRNLLVSATGTGKTVIAAVDYARLAQTLPRSRLLFVAHRSEILRQSIDTFRYALRDFSFGERWAGGERPQHFDHVFASIQTISRTNLERLDPKHFDVIIVDEFHHAAADSYEKFLNYVVPKELIGLTATPERSDGLPILHWFDNRIAAELRLWDAIDQHRLVPFVYYGIADNLDFREIPWRRGRGYDADGMTNLFTANDAWGRKVIAELGKRTDNISRMRALGFCVSIAHARFMARLFNESNIPSVAIWSDTAIAEREQALLDLKHGRIKVVFSVDIFNEGVDVPAIDTLIMLRPTDSPTLFLQQLGRGLRHYDGKGFCTVLDFVGMHRKEFRFDRRFGALFTGTRKQLAAHVQQGFPFLPAGCHMELDRIAADRVLKNIKDSVPNRWPEKVQELRRLASGRPQVRLSEYLIHTGLSLEDIYSPEHSWSDLVEEAGLDVLERGPHEKLLRRACGRLLHVDDLARIEAYREIANCADPPSARKLLGQSERYSRMFLNSIAGSLLDAKTELMDGFQMVWRHPQVLAEITELMDVLVDRIQHKVVPLADRPAVPLYVHAQYTRVEIQAAFGDGQRACVPAWREGVRWMNDEQCDVFVFTLDKTSGGFSPTTRYKDYAISRDLIHWESQSTTRADSPTGRRYRTHVSHGSSVMLFARVREDERAFYFLGPAEYVVHESEMPMAITWRLKHRLSGDLFQSFAVTAA